MSQSIIQRSLAGGEIAPSLYGRADQTKYQTGAKKLKNFKVLKHGGVGNRGGTKFIAEVKNSNLSTYLIKFVFNNEQSYAIEVGNEYFRFYRSAARIVVSGVSAWATTTVYSVGDLVSNGGTNYYCKTAHTAGVSFAGDAANWHALTDDIYEIPTPYATADLADLQFVQSGDVVTITHPSYDTRDLTRTGHTSWTLIARTFQPGISAPAGPSNTGAAGTSGDGWVITAVADETYEESVASAVTQTSATASSGSPITVSWTAVSGAQEYNVYKRKNGVFGFAGVAAGTSFVDNGITQDMSITPPTARNPFSGAGNRPAVVTYYQQRIVFANQNNNTQRILGSRSGAFNNFTISSPLRSDDAVTFSIAGRQVNAVRHMIDLGTLVVLTQSGEWLIEGNQDGALSANQPANPRQIGYNGASKIMPMIVNDSILFMQARGNVLRDLRYTVDANGGIASYKGRDLTVFAGHLFKNKSILRTDYAQIPDSVAWLIRDDGVLLGLTYLTDHEVWGWHQHHTDGAFEDVCVIPEGGRDVEYLVVKRSIDGATKRYIEWMSNRDYSEIKVDATFLDSFLTYDGRNSSATTVELSTAGGWTVDDEITVEAALGTPFVSGDVGNEIVIWSGDDEIRIQVTAYTGSTEVSGYPNKTVPASLRSTALSTWGRAVDQIGGLDHLEGKDIAVFGDGDVVASPNNPDYTTVTVSGGIATLDRPYLLVHAGLAYECDVETLDLDIDGQQMRDTKKIVNNISLLVENTRGLFMGPDAESLHEYIPETPTQYDQPLAEKTGIIEMPIAATYNESGSFLIRQKDPLPATILSLIPAGNLGG